MPGFVILAHEVNPRSAIRITIRVRYICHPAGDLPISDQLDQLPQIVIAQWSDAQPRCFDDDAEWRHFCRPPRSGSSQYLGGLGANRISTEPRIAIHDMGESL